MSQQSNLSSAHFRFEDGAPMALEQLMPWHDFMQGLRNSEKFQAAGRLINRLIDAYVSYFNHHADYQLQC